MATNKTITSLWFISFRVIAFWARIMVEVLIIVGARIANPRYPFLKDILHIEIEGKTNHRF
jgi:hypothetical protein